MTTGIPAYTELETNEKLEDEYNSITLGKPTQEQINNGRIKVLHLTTGEYEALMRISVGNMEDIKEKVNEIISDHFRRDRDVERYGV